MLDAGARRIIDPPLNMLGRHVARTGIGANAVTLAGLALGLVAAGLIYADRPWLALLFLAISRLADGLDGAVARATAKTDFGGYLDIAADFLFYGAVPLAFVLNDPAANGAAGAFLLASFYFNATSFLGYAILAEKHDMETAAQGSKSLYFSNGILEGTETIAFFVLLCLLPGLFAPLAWVFGALCYATALLRIAAAHRIFTTTESP
ncbi:Phosphatidylglycerophosphate synthase [Tranquillimonas rosea]|uniref:Phosphatidylglycerophosphate synthase n=1 Tax=Tranquillimonas rosea TaxID=641238 RepID=A0A1H9PGK0_9RHOB|nr:CDP-alcohol phosphatidyltransferase family protein [Tranquillimonas rosea]SER46995.1 Phosphatidylglycerophosphate synthase [Tranquillimonas rosea]